MRYWGAAFGFTILELLELLGLLELLISHLSFCGGFTTETTVPVTNAGGGFLMS
jgi:hypothetical protein